MRPRSRSASPAPGGPYFVVLVIQGPVGDRGDRGEPGDPGYPVSIRTPTRWWHPACSAGTFLSPHRRLAGEQPSPRDKPSLPPSVPSLKHRPPERGLRPEFMLTGGPSEGEDEIGDRDPFPRRASVSPSVAGNSSPNRSRTQATGGAPGPPPGSSSHGQGHYSTALQICEPREGTMTHDYRTSKRSGAPPGRKLPRPPALPGWAPSLVSPWLPGAGGCARPPWRPRPAGPTSEWCFLSPTRPPPRRWVDSSGGSNGPFKAQRDPPCGIAWGSPLWFLLP